MPHIDQDIFWSQILNGLDFTTFVVYAIYMTLGALMHFAIDVRYSVKNNPHTPHKFKFWYMVKDNVARGFLVVSIIFVSIVLHKGLFGNEPSAVNMLLVGLSIDSLIGNMVKSLKNYNPQQIDLNKRT